MRLQRRAAIALAVAAAFAIGSAPARAQGIEIQPRWKPTDAPPDIEGVRLGDPRERVVATLGEPDPSLIPDDPAAPLRTLRYRHGALLVAIDKSNEVARILLNKPDGGALAGIRVGDRLSAMLTSWGEPTTSTNTVGRYQADNWRVTVKADLASNQVLRLMLARQPPDPVIPPLPDPTIADAPQVGAPPPAQ